MIAIERKSAASAWKYVLNDGATKSESFKKQSIDQLGSVFKDCQMVEQTSNGVLVIETRGTCTAMNNVISALDDTAKFEAGLFYADKNVKRKTLITPKIFYSIEVEKVELQKRKKIFYVKKELRKTDRGDMKLAQVFKFNNENTILIKEKNKNQVRMNVGELTILYFPGFDINSIVVKECSASESKTKIIDKEIFREKGSSNIFYYFI